MGHSHSELASILLIFLAVNKRRKFRTSTEIAQRISGLKVLQPIEAQTKEQYIRRAESMSRKGGAIALSRTGDPETGDFDEAAEILGRFGEVPQEFASG